jgi:glutamyl-tRNA synthetase
MLLQGPSQAIVSLEWDSIWAINKKVIDPIAPRFWAIEAKQMYAQQHETRNIS